MSARRPAFPNIDVKVGVWRKLERILPEGSISGQDGLWCAAVAQFLHLCCNVQTCSLFFFHHYTHTLVEKQVPRPCVVPRLRLCLHRLRAERGQQELFTLCTCCRTYSTCHGGCSVRTWENGVAAFVTLVLDPDCVLCFYLSVTS